MTPYRSYPRGSTYVLPSRSTTRNADEGWRFFNCFAGVAPSAMFATTSVKLRMRPLVGSHATMAGLSDNACTSDLTTVSLASSGGIVTASAVPPSGGRVSAARGAGVAAAGGAWAGRHPNATYIATPAAAISSVAATHTPADDAGS